MYLGRNSLHTDDTDTLSVSVLSGVRNSYLSTSTTNQYEYKDEIDDDNNENNEA